MGQTFLVKTDEKWDEDGGKTVIGDYGGHG